MIISDSELELRKINPRKEACYVTARSQDSQKTLRRGRSCIALMSKLGTKD